MGIWDGGLGPIPNPHIRKIYKINEINLIIIIIFNKIKNNI